MSTSPEKPGRSIHVRQPVCEPEKTHLMTRLYRRVASLNTPEKFRAYLSDLGLSMNFDPDIDHGENSPLTRPANLQGKQVGNRLCVLPMEGWDGTKDGKPSHLTRKRWGNFGRSGAKLIWGGEAVAIRHDGRANPNQLLIEPSNLAALEDLRRHLVSIHEQKFGTSRDLLMGLQLTHSGRFSRPNRKDKLEPKILYHDPILDRRFGISPEQSCLTDSEIQGLIEDFVQAARMAWDIGFHFVDIKHCHGYLGNEFLNARHRTGPYGGSFENRTRFLRNIVSGIRSAVPMLGIGIRINAFDMDPFEKSPSGQGVSSQGNNPFLFGRVSPKARTDSPETPWDSGQETPEVVRLLKALRSLSVQLVCLSGGSPYYNPHIQRPALFPPSDGYEPPEDPLVGVNRHIEFTRFVKREFPDLTIVGSGYSYLQEWLPHVAQRQLRDGAVDFVGLGRMMLAYPEFSADILAGKTFRRKSICRTFSDCTTAPRQQLVSGCFPLDPYYRDHPHGQALRRIKRKLKGF